MNTQAYIASGIIERYALGQASCNEAMELGIYAERHADVREALDEALQTVEGLAQVAAVKPRPALRERVLNAVAEEAKASKATPTPAVKASPSSGRMRSLQLASGIAALLALVAGMGFLIQNSQFRSLKEETAALEQSVRELTQQSGEWKAELDQQSEQLALIRDAATRRIALMAISGDSRVDVYWNPDRRSAYFDVLNLAQAPQGSQYQLWAIVDGTPVDMGLIPLEAEPASWQSFPFVETPQAFAITLEQEGGSPVPSLDQLVVIGNVVA